MVEYIINIVKGRPKGDRTKTIREVIGIAHSIQEARRKSIAYIKKSDRFTVLTVRPTYHPKIGDKFIVSFKSMDDLDEVFAFGRGDVECISWVKKKNNYYIEKPPMYDEYIIDTNGKILYKEDYGW